MYHFTIAHTHECISRQIIIHTYFATFVEPELANISSTEEVVLHQDVSCCTIIYLMFLYDLTHTFPVHDVIVDNGYPLSCVDQRELGTSRLTIAHNGLPVFLRVRSLRGDILVNLAAAGTQRIITWAHCCLCLENTFTFSRLFAHLKFFHSIRVIWN